MPSQGFKLPHKYNTVLAQTFAVSKFHYALYDSSNTIKAFIHKTIRNFLRRKSLENAYLATRGSVEKSEYSQIDANGMNDVTQCDVI